MSKMEEVRSQMMQAMKNGDKPRKECLSLLLSALKAKYIDKRADLTEEEENEVVAREMKQLRETLESLPAGREELAEFAPKAMSEEEVRAALQSVMAELNMDSPAPKDKGRIMKALMPLVKGKADGGMVNRLVGEVLGQ